MSCSSDQDCDGDCCSDGGPKPCEEGLCCSEWGWCNQCPPEVPGSGFNYDADHGEDSRLIAYVGNWQRCPTDQMVDAYSHIVIAFAVSYTWAENKNLCDEQCAVAPVVPICENENQQDLVDMWRAQGKKVILSFGGAGMGGNWAGDRNNCWDNCFGREEQLSTDLVNLVASHNADGIDIDYEYCYDVGGKQSVDGRCDQVTSLYSDEKAQRFLNDLTAKLRIKLDRLQAQNGYNRGRYELTHAPMDIDLTPYQGQASKYFEILTARNGDLDFIMPQFYNGYFTPKQGLATVSSVWGSDGLTTLDIYASLANDMFENEPWKVVMGFCLNVCTGQAYAQEAVAVMSELSTIQGGEFACNGGAFFWVADEDKHGLWSDAVASEVSRTAGCSHGLIAQRPAKPAQTGHQGQASPTDYEGHVQTPHLGVEEEEEFAGNDESITSFGITAQDLHHGGPCAALPVCRDIGITTDLSCQVACSAKATPGGRASFWMRQDEMESIGHTTPHNCGQGCVCLENGDASLRRSEPTPTYACVHSKSDESSSESSSVGIALGLVLSFLVVAAVTAFYILSRKRRKQQERAATFSGIDGPLEQDAALPQLTKGDPETHSTQGKTIYDLHGS
ncbi:hypothetical protein ACHAXT_004645 [Thalassiosira profunda]